LFCCLPSRPQWERILAHVSPTTARDGHDHDGANQIEGEQDGLDKSRPKKTDEEDPAFKPPESRGIHIAADTLASAS
jgi:hypothetical protein